MSVLYMLAERGDLRSVLFKVFPYQCLGFYKNLLASLLHEPVPVLAFIYPRAEPVYVFEMNILGHG